MRMEMNDIKKMKILLNAIGVPFAQQCDLCCYTLIAMAGLKKNLSWKDATNEWMRIHDIIEFISHNYKKVYAENSRETFRKKALHHFRIGALIEDNHKATNSSDYRYRLTPEFLKVIHEEGKDSAVKEFLLKHETLISIYASKKKMNQIPVTVNGQMICFSVGKHNLLQKEIIEEFAPRFAPGAECLYIGDTVEKDLVNNKDKLHDLGFEISVHQKMPDIILYIETRKWLYFIESVTSVGPMDAKRIYELSELTKEVQCGKIYVSAFPDFKTFKRFSESLAWDTEVWIAEMPDHMIHLNGDKFLGPR